MGRENAGPTSGTHSLLILTSQRASATAQFFTLWAFTMGSRKTHSGSRSQAVFLRP